MDTPSYHEDMRRDIARIIIDAEEGAYIASIKIVDLFFQRLTSIRDKIEQEKEPIKKIHALMTKKRLPGSALSKELYPRHKYNNGIDKALSIIDQHIKELEGNNE